MPIQLHVDLQVKAGKEAELAGAFRGVFVPAISRQEGFVEVHLLRLRAAVVGPLRENASWRLLISFLSEEQRQAWVAGADHQQAWPAIAACVEEGGVRAALYEIV